MYRREEVHLEESYLKEPNGCYYCHDLLGAPGNASQAEMEMDGAELWAMIEDRSLVWHSTCWHAVAVALATKGAGEEVGSIE